MLGEPDLCSSVKRVIMPLVAALEEPAASSARRARGRRAPALALDKRRFWLLNGAVSRMRELDAVAGADGRVETPCARPDAALALLVSSMKLGALLDASEIASATSTCTSSKGAMGLVGLEAPAECDVGGVDGAAVCVVAVKKYEGKPAVERAPVELPALTVDPFGVDAEDAAVAAVSSTGGN